MSAPTAAAIARDALTKAEKALNDQESHERLCAERYGNIHSALADLKGLFKWGGITGFGILITVLGFLVVQMLNANDAARRAADTKIELLERQLRQQPVYDGASPVTRDPSVHT